MGGAGDVFRVMHSSGCFLLPNPWDAGSAILLERMGYRALATSSAALGFTLGLRDEPGAIGLEDVLDNVRLIVDATSLPVNVDFQNAYAHDADGVAANVKRCVETGAAGLSVEDACGDSESPLYDMELAVERIRAAREAIDSVDPSVVLTARCEAFLFDVPNSIDVVLERLVRFSDAGADCLFAPGVGTREGVKRVVDAVAPKPVNVLGFGDWMSVESLGALGVRRISVGSALARMGWKGFLDSSRSVLETGSFGELAGAESFESLNAQMRGGASGA